MISISRLLCDFESPGDYLRYGPDSQAQAISNKAVSPVVVWNCTRQCNLNCIHCYASAGSSKESLEMDTNASMKFIDDLADFNVPVILFSGGEPLLRKDIFQVAKRAVNKNIRIALSTNGTLITDDVAVRLKELGFAEVGISIDGIGDRNDRMRGCHGAYKAALKGIQKCISHDLRVSLRLTITRHNYQEIPDIFKLIEDMGIGRVCFYHLAYSGRGSEIKEEDVDHVQKRKAIDQIILHTLDLHQRGLKKEVLTVGNHADGVYLYLMLKQSNPNHAEAVQKLLLKNGGNNSGIKIAAVDDRGYVHADQFWWHYSLGNVQSTRFADIWMNDLEPLLHDLRNRKPLLKGKCARCKYLNLCNGNLRVRAEAMYGDLWYEDPACYLTEEEICE